MIQIYNYNNFQIEFEVINGQVMANATAMCNVFGKRPAKWMESPKIKRYIKALEAKSENGTLVEARQGGKEPGTWIHEKLILKLAQWLSVDFEIWCDEKIADLLKNGVTNITDNTNITKNEDEVVFQALTIMNTRIINLSKQNELLSEKCEKANETIQLQAPKVEYADLVLSSESSHTTTTIAKELGMTAVRLNQLLHDKGIQFKQDGHWVLYRKYQDKGYTKTRTATFLDSNGNSRTNITTVWTEEGRHFIHSELNPIPKNKTLNLNFLKSLKRP